MSIVQKMAVGEVGMSGGMPGGMPGASGMPDMGVMGGSGGGAPPSDDPASGPTIE